jgi:hypothetical protein
VLARRLADQYERPPAAALEEAVVVLHMLTSFETFDALAGPDRSPKTSRRRCTGSPSRPLGYPRGEHPVSVIVEGGQNQLLTRGWPA